MISLPIVLAILFTHWVADFVLQTHEQAVNKSKNVFMLTMHVLTYTIALLFGVLAFTAIFHSQFIISLIGQPSITTCTYHISLWIGLNGLSHWITDYFTSKWTATLWKQQKVHNFFVVIGLDQLLHIIVLLLTWHLII